ncbi:MAG: type III secretion protein HrpB7 [Paraburkholderia sp.]|jgi:type III secretion system HrpB7-like protein|nr:type III secretion protein HrpB7 [Paraburkholderia sp.]
MGVAAGVVAGAAAGGGAGRRVAALERSRARRQRLDNSLRAALNARREERAERERARDAKAQEVEREAEVLRYYQQRIDTMMTGGDVFSLEALNGCRLYIGVVGEKLRVLEAALAQAEALVRESEGAIAQTRREIEQNLGRIDLCGARIAEIRRKQENAASDASDEEAEEAALARRLRERGMAA